MRKILVLLCFSFIATCACSQVQVFMIQKTGGGAPPPPPPTIDSNAQKFIDSVQFYAGITLTTLQKNAIDTLVRDLKGQTNPRYTTGNYWSRFVAFYPIIGGTATAHSFNLVNPRNSDAAFRLTFEGTITHSANGMVGDGSTGDANTHISSPNLALTSTHIAFYSRTNYQPTANMGDMGTWNYPSDGALYLGENFINGDNYRAVNTTNIGPSADALNTLGFWIATRTDGTTMYQIKNGGVLHTDASAATSLPGNHIRILAWGDGSGDTPAFFSIRQCAAASVGTGFTTAEAVIFSNIVNQFETRLSRNVY